MNFQDNYFEDEVRDGFYVPAIMKRAWAAELEVLQEIDRICQKHKISYFAEWGTLLGTVRHSGFVPWDDDLDISMKRKDYQRFLEVAEAELPEGFSVINMENRDDFWYFLARVVGKPRICFEPDHLEKFHEFPYIAGIDIFVLDYVSSDEKKEEFRVKAAEYILAVADSLENSKIQGKNLEDCLKKIESICRVSIKRNQPITDLRKELYQLTERIFQSFTEEESDCLTQMMPCGLYGNKMYLPKEYYRESLRFPFENTTIPVPIAYDTMLQKRYGEYMKPVRSSGSHGYPFFEEQHKKLESVLDFELPKYKFSMEDALREPGAQQCTYKTRIRELCKKLEILSKELEDRILLKGTSENNEEEEIQNLLIESQSTAIEMGNEIEKYKGEGLTVIHKIENFCETVFQVFESVSQGLRNDAENYFRKFLEELGNILEEVEKRC